MLRERLKILKIAYLILCHTDEKHICRLVNKLTEADNTYVYLHIDKKSPINEFKKLLDNNKQVKFIKNRVNIFWGIVLYKQL